MNVEEKILKNRCCFTTNKSTSTLQIWRFVFDTTYKLAFEKSSANAI